MKRTNLLYAIIEGNVVFMIKFTNIFFYYLRFQIYTHFFLFIYLLNTEKIIFYKYCYFRLPRKKISETYQNFLQERYKNFATIHSAIRHSIIKVIITNNSSTQYRQQISTA